MDNILNLKQLVLKSLDTNKALDIVSIDLENKSTLTRKEIIDITTNGADKTLLRKTA